MKLNPNAPLPLYHQLADILLRRIRNGQYSPGKRIPSENQLTSEFGIGRPTVRQAIDLLVRRRYLTKRRGSGTYVCEPAREVDLFSLDGTSASFRKKGIATESRIISPPALVLVDSAGQNPFAGKSVYFLARLTTVDRNPTLIEELFLHPDLFPGLDSLNLNNQSLSEIAEERYYLKPSAGKQSFRIGYLEPSRARLLKITPSTPVLEVHRYLHFDQTQNGVYSILYCLTEKFSFSQLIGVPSNAE